jgi:hypothetical protein
MKYPKIQTLFKRDPDNKYIIMEGVYSEPIFEFIDRWVVSEKIHGMNIRIMYEYSPRYSVCGVVGKPFETLKFGGRTDNAQLPVFLYEKLMELFDKEKLREVFVKDGKSTKVILFGEGYGERIQKGGGNYIKGGVDFALFDIYVFESNLDRNVRGWWLTREAVHEIGYKLGVKRAPEMLDIYSKEEIIDFVRNKVKSQIAINGNHIAEGIVARAEDPPILFRNGHPVMFKLKVEDYTKLEGSK